MAPERRMPPRILEPAYPRARAWYTEAIEAALLLVASLERRLPWEGACAPARWRAWRRWLTLRQGRRHCVAHGRNACGVIRCCRPPTGGAYRSSTRAGGAGRRAPISRVLWW